jgi:hypothetical protein
MGGYTLELHSGVLSGILSEGTLWGYALNTLWIHLKRLDTLETIACIKTTEYT